MNKIIKHAAAILATGILATPAFAVQETFNLAWSGAPYSNSAIATGRITLDTDAFTTSEGEITLLEAQVTDLSLTIAGARVGNGTFAGSDFQFLVAGSPSPLDFSKQLVGQALTDGAAWGQASFGQGGDFNLFANNAAAPTGTWFFTLTTAAGVGDRMALMSMTAVPEAQNVAMMFAGLGLLGVVARRRKAQA